jgi:hypothetical protein
VVERPQVSAERIRVGYQLNLVLDRHRPLSDNRDDLMVVPDYKISQLLMTGDDLVFRAQHVLDEWVACFLAAVSDLAVCQRVQPGSGDEYAGVDVLEQGRIRTFCDQHPDAIQRDRLFLNGVRAIVDQWFRDLSGPVNRRDQMLFHQIEPHFRVRAKPLWIFSPAHVIRPRRKDEVVILAQHNGPDSVLL